MNLKNAISKQEISSLIVTTLVVAFAFGFNDGSDTFQVSRWLLNYIRFFLIVGVSYLTYIYIIKLVARSRGCEANFDYWKVESLDIRRRIKPRKRLFKQIPLGLILPVFFAILTFGKFPFVASANMNINAHPDQRIRQRYVSLTEIEEARISLMGPVTFLSLAFLFKIISLLGFFDSIVFDKFIFVNSILAVYHILPFPTTDGLKVMMGARTFYIFNLTFILVSAFLLQSFNLIGTLIFALLFAIVAGVSYHYFFRFK